MTKQEAVDYIHSHYKFGIKLGLENIKTLLAALDNPQDDLRFVHVAGTNGKGSTTSFIAHGFMAAGYTVGRYISPYIEHFNERIQFNQSMITDASLIKHTKVVKSAIESINKKDFAPTVFEIITAIGLSFFREKNPDVVILEVGMGGRYDSTNIIAAPLCTVITPIGMDHMEYLGDTIEKIASEKAGIIKVGSRVVTAQNDSRAQRVISDACRELSSPLQIVSEPAQSIKYSSEGTTFSYLDEPYCLSMLGTYQVQNACLAIETLKNIDAHSDFTISLDSIKTGILRAKWAGRFEKIAKSPDVIIDGAHNNDGIDVLLDSLDTYYKHKNKVAVFGMMADKAIDEILPKIIPVFDAFLLVTPDNPRAMTASDMQERLIEFGFKGNIACLASIDEIIVAYENLNPNNVMVGFGSLYFIGEMRKKFIH